MYIKRMLLFIVLAGLVIGGILAYFVYSTFLTPNTGFDNDEAYVFINSDASFEEVKESLEPLLMDMESFEKTAKQKGYDTRVKGGRYVLKKGLSNNDIVNALRSKNVPVKVSFNNQERLADLAGRISQQIEPDSLSLLHALNDEEFLKANDFDEHTKLAMYLPNSYEFFWNTSAAKFRDRMLEEYKRFWNAQRMQKADELNLKPTEVIALASIVHKETAKVDERPRVAGLYLNRIRQKMALQADPTIIYAIKKETGNYDTVIKRVLFRDLEISSPYNTYKNRGIPPGPIMMPDISAIDGVLNAEKHQYLYMVANIKNFGYHKFAKSLAQHNQNKVQYIRWLNEQNIKR
jgi:UPF0755 protein